MYISGAQNSGACIWSVLELLSVHDLLLPLLAPNPLHDMLQSNLDPEPAIAGAAAEDLPITGSSQQRLGLDGMLASVLVSVVVLVGVLVAGVLMVKLRATAAPTSNLWCCTCACIHAPQMVAR